MKIDRKVVEDYRYTLKMNGEEFSTIRLALFQDWNDDRLTSGYRDRCKALYDVMVKKMNEND